MAGGWVSGAGNIAREIASALCRSAPQFVHLGAQQVRTQRHRFREPQANKAYAPTPGRKPQWLPSTWGHTSVGQSAIAPVCPGRVRPHSCPEHFGPKQDHCRFRAGKKGVGEWMDLGMTQEVAQLRDKHCAPPPPMRQWETAVVSPTSSLPAPLAAKVGVGIKKSTIYVCKWIKITFFYPLDSVSTVTTWAAGSRTLLVVCLHTYREIFHNITHSYGGLSNIYLCFNVKYNFLLYILYS